MSHKYKVATEQIITVHDHFCGALANNAIGLDKGNIDKKSIMEFEVLIFFDTYINVSNRGSVAIIENCWVFVFSLDIAPIIENIDAYKRYPPMNITVERNKYDTKVWTLIKLVSESSVDIISSQIEVSAKMSIRYAIMMAPTNQNKIWTVATINPESSLDIIISRSFNAVNKTSEILFFFSFPIILNIELENCKITI